MKGIPVDDCLFCKIVRGEIDSETVLESENVIAFRDINPVAPTHVLVIPKEHIRSADELTEAHGRLLGEIFEAIASIRRAEGIEKGHRIVTNVGPEAGQSVDHLHWHVIGGRSMSWPPG
jgi:histidine triad (HIT) family protein